MNLLQKEENFINMRTTPTNTSEWESTYADYVEKSRIEKVQPELEEERKIILSTWKKKSSTSGKITWIYSSKMPDYKHKTGI